jgi:uncharacterized membrane protein
MPARSIYLFSNGIEQGPLYVLQFSNISLRASELGISPYTGQWQHTRMRLLPKTCALFVTLSLSLSHITQAHTKTLYCVVVITIITAAYWLCSWLVRLRILLSSKKIPLGLLA